MILRWIKEQFSREYHVICNGKRNRPSEKGLLRFVFYIERNFKVLNFDVYVPVQRCQFLLQS